MDLIITLEYPPFKGGIANYCENLKKYWPEPDNIFVLHNNENKLINEKLPFLKWLPCLWYLWNEIKKHRINHILVHHILPLGTAVYLISKITKISYSIILHGTDLGVACSMRRKKWLAKKILYNADNIICGSSYVASYVTKQFFSCHHAQIIVRPKNYKNIFFCHSRKSGNPGLIKFMDSRFRGNNKQGTFYNSKKSNKITVINPGVNYIKYNSEYVTQIKKKYNLENKIILLSVGRLVKRKGFDKTIAAMPEVLKQVPNLIYVIWGHGSEAENLKQQAKNLKLNNILFLINIADVDNKQKDALYNIADIFIMPARSIGQCDYEGFGIVYLEANIAGKPVIAGDSGGARDAVSHGVSGLIVDPENATSIANAIIKLCLDKGLRKKLGQQGKERAINNFMWEEQIEKIFRITHNA
ncbi:MAG: glycosyltransferase family 4 protein [Patescibacteria group bacterium]|nr:glycosyltransferase family 4 protein [Patescibacteria group bacterium]MBU1160227.1 glycosyltransferase family 4 protein [Patescibacteria group bacterium]MBU1778170.1 glycosyltransferase family 4 protein [Patescibacteria group bacterium]MBU1987108.1 glycosyltransferase family 4 protein [Patescibacteria group bacterium]MBU2456406.1 glycosyltransferase family 4 protein [Patescibacteria group bacterium]